MPRKARFFIDEVPVHVVQRGHCLVPVFFEEQDYATYMHCVHEAGKRYKVKLHSFCLMTNHVHLLLTPVLAESISLFMQFVGRHYVPYINEQYRRSGTLWEGRFKASLIDSETYLLDVMRYIELNPVRAFMVESPEEYQWSSFKYNTGQLAMASIIEHSVFVGLGRTLAESRSFYLKGFNQVLSQKAVKKITAAWLTGTPLGDQRFELKIEETLSKRVGLARKGRPRKIN